MLLIHSDQFFFVSIGSYLFPFVFRIRELFWLICSLKKYGQQFAIILEADVI